MEQFLDWMYWNWEQGELIVTTAVRLRIDPIGFPGVSSIYEDGSAIVGAFVLLALLAAAYRKTRLRTRQTPDCS